MHSALYFYYIYHAKNQTANKGRVPQPAKFYKQTNHENKMKTKNLSRMLLLLLCTISCVSCIKNDEPKDKVETIKMYVSAETGIYYDFFDSTGQHPMEGMLIRENENQEWRCTSFSAIYGFEYEKGYGYTLSIEKTTLANPPADGSIYTYKLIEILHRTTPGVPAGNRKRQVQPAN